jgi:type II restriction/modification system DNA methylase subunit YeeA
MLRLYEFRVLDPACGSGNFLYLALKGLRDLERRVKVEAREFGIRTEDDFLQTGPHNVLGLEINDYAAELARVTVWIGDIQWCRRNGYQHSVNPILKSLDAIQHRDALIDPDGREAEWPTADVIVGNPPFLGTKKQWGGLGRDYTEKLRALYESRVPGFADLVCYWFEKARAQLEMGKVRYVGLVATNSIRGGANRKVLDRIADTGVIFNAWADEPWINEGAAVRVSLVCFASNEVQRRLDGGIVDRINPDLTTGNALSTANKLTGNSGCAFVATVKAGAFDVPGSVARAWLNHPNPHGRPNSDVLRPWANGMDVTRRPSDTWIIDFGVDTQEHEAMLYERPYAHVIEYVLPLREKSNRAVYKARWWRLAEPIPKMRAALLDLPRCIVTPTVAKHRLFVWMDVRVLADHQLIVIARADDATFGILHSRFHELWSLRLGTSLEDRPRYTPTTTFETFPFPAGLTPAQTRGPTERLESGAVLPTVAVERRATAIRIAEAAQRLNALRENWLNPQEWVERVPELVPGYPERIIPKPDHAADLKKRTLTNLYNARPAWLDHAHQTLDAAVAAAYGWDDDSPTMADEEILRRLLALNRERAGA